MLQTTKHNVNQAGLDNEQALVLAAQKDIKHFAPLYDKYYEPIFRYVYQRLDDKEVAFDITQQVFLKAINNLSKYEYRGFPFSSWLYRIAFSAINDVFRAQKAQRTINIESANIYSIIEELEENKIDTYHDKIVAIISKELDEDELQLIEMRFFEKRAFKEIAEILDITENNAKVKTYRILDKLKKKLTSNYSENK